MKMKGTVALCCAVLGVILWLRFFEKEVEQPPDAPLLQFDQEKVTGITINDGNDSLSFQRHDNGWDLSTTPSDHADTVEVNKLLVLAAHAKPFDLLRSKELKNRLPSLGLQSPRRSLMIHQEGAPDQTLYFGNEAVGDKSIFVRLNKNKTVFIIPSALADQAFRPHDDFRDHLLADLEVDQLRTVELHQGLGVLSLQLQDDQWKMVQPTETTINKHAFKYWITSLLQAPILARVANDDGDLTSYGLDQPRAEIILSQENEKEPLHLWLGKVAEEKDAPTIPSVYVRSSARHAIFKIPASLEKVFMITPDTLRDHQLFAINLDGIDQIIIKKEGVTLSLHHQLGGSDGWITEEADPVLILGSDLQHMIENLEKTEVINFEAATPTLLKKIGLEPPSDAIASIRFIAHLSENTPDNNAGDYVVCEILFGAPVDNPGSLLYARVSNSPDLRQVPVKTLEKLDLSLFKKK